MKKRFDLYYYIHVYIHNYKNKNDYLIDLSCNHKYESLSENKLIVLTKIERDVLTKLIEFR